MLISRLAPIAPNGLRAADDQCNRRHRGEINQRDQIAHETGGWIEQRAKDDHRGQRRADDRKQGRGEKAHYLRAARDNHLLRKQFTDVRERLEPRRSHAALDHRRHFAVNPREH